jgi:hypothetical protein
MFLRKKICSGNVLDPLQKYRVLDVLPPDDLLGNVSDLDPDPRCDFNLDSKSN